MESYKEYKSTLESKQVGIIYHFTRCANIDSILKDFRLMSHNGYISTSRNFGLADGVGDISKSYGYIVRLNLDGNKLSHKYKIKPILGLEDDNNPIDFKNKNRITRDSGESEELVLSNVINIKDSLISITVSGNTECYNYLKNKYTELVVIYDRKFKPIKEDVEFTFNDKTFIIF